MYKHLLLIIFFLPSLILAKEEADDFVSFLKSLNSIATKTKQNIDYMPSTVTVLHGSDLHSLGVNTLYEALSFVPGIETSMIHTGWKRLITRGLHNPDSFVFDKIKLLIDGVNVSSRLYGTIYYYMDFPIHLIERIEVLRGASSALYGDGAYNGAINVITKTSLKSEKFISVSYGSYDYRSLNTLLPLSFANFNGAIDAYIQKDNKLIDVPRDFIYKEGISDFHRDAQSDERLRNGGIGLSLKSENYSIIARYNDYKSGNYFGFNELLEPNIDDKYNAHKSFHSELSLHKEIADAVNLRMKVNLSTAEFSFKATARPKNPLPFNIELETLYKERSLGASTDVEVKKFDKHTLLFGFESDLTDVKKNEYGTNFDFPEGEQRGYAFSKNGEVVTYSGDRGFLNSDAGRDHFALYLQDLYEVSDRMMLSMNIRYDHYKRFDSDFNSRLGVVYDISDKLTFKFQYAEAFRIASFIEAFQTEHAILKKGNKNLKNEKQRSFESALIYKPSVNQVLRVNGYYSKFYDTINISEIEPNDYDNEPNRRAKGFELEYKVEATPSQKFALNYSYTDSTYGPLNEAILNNKTPEIANHLFKAYHMLKITDDISFNSILSYIGSREGSLVKNKEAQNIRAYWLVDIAAEYDLNEQLKMILSVDDLLNERENLPSYKSYNKEHPALPQVGRNIIASLHFVF